MAIDFTVTAQGQAPIEHALHGLVERFGDIRPLMERFGSVLETSTIERFDEERAPDGTKWLPSFRAKHEGGKTLTDTARLRLSIRPVASADQVEIGTNVIYARIHQEGGTIRAKGKALAFTLPGLGLRLATSVTIPARPFLGLSADDRDELAAQVEDYIAEVAPEVEP